LKTNRSHGKKNKISVIVIDDFKKDIFRIFLKYIDIREHLNKIGNFKYIRTDIEHTSIKTLILSKKL